MSNNSREVLEVGFSTASSILTSLLSKTISNSSLKQEAATTTASIMEILENSTTPYPQTQPASTVYPFLESTTSFTNPNIQQADQICNGRWLPVNHLYFQLANVFLFLSYLAPNGIYGILYLRVTLSIGCFFFAIWGYLILCALDTLIWNVVFVLINLVHIVIIAYSLRPIRFSNELEQVRNSFNLMTPRYIF